jgi:hypothetical protein
VVLTGLLLALLLPALVRTRQRAENALCISNLRQWGIATAQYASHHQNYFPDNTTAPDVRYCSTNMIRFWQQYLLPRQEAAEGKDRYEVLGCPTDQWRRLANLGSDADPAWETKPLLTSYLWLPHRLVTAEWDYKITGLEEWHSRKRLGGVLAGAPILIDRLQGTGTSRTGGRIMGPIDWYTTADGERSPTACHRGTGGVPQGGNVLFEDGHVSWYPRHRIELGSRSPGGDGWQLFYKVPLGR